MAFKTVGKWISNHSTFKQKYKNLCGLEVSLLSQEPESAQCVGSNPMQDREDFSNLRVVKLNCLYLTVDNRCCESFTTRIFTMSRKVNF